MTMTKVVMEKKQRSKWTQKELNLKVRLAALNSLYDA